MERLQALADMSIRRACGFALLGICTLMVGMAHEFRLALQTGAILVSVMAVVLVYKGVNAPAKPYKRTELWLLIDDRPSLPEPRLQQVIGGTLRDRYIWHAKVAGCVAGLLWLFWLMKTLAA